MTTKIYDAIVGAPTPLRWDGNPTAYQYGMAALAAIADKLPGKPLVIDHRGAAVGSVVSTRFDERLGVVHARVRVDHRAGHDAIARGLRSLSLMVHKMRHRRTDARSVVVYEVGDIDHLALVRRGAQPEARLVMDDQDRDEHGRFASGGGAPAASTEAKAATKVAKASGSATDHHAAAMAHAKAAGAHREAGNRERAEKHEKKAGELFAKATELAKLGAEVVGGKSAGEVAEALAGREHGDAFDVDAWDPSASARSELRPVCRLEPGQTSRDCPEGTAGRTDDGRLDLGDLIMTPEGREVWLRATEARYAAEEQGADVAGALRIFHAIVDPAIARLNNDHDRSDAEKATASMATTKIAGAAGPDKESRCGCSGDTPIEDRCEDCSDTDASANSGLSNNVDDDTDESTSDRADGLTDDGGAPSAPATRADHAAIAGQYPRRGRRTKDVKKAARRDSTAIAPQHKGRHEKAPKQRADAAPVHSRFVDKVGEALSPAELMHSPQMARVARGGR